MTALLLSRLQFVWVIAWHILLPAFTVGVASYIAVLEGMYFATGRQIYFRISGFWIKIFAISFGMGVVSGIIMPFQFGTNWSRFSDATANVLSPLLAYEGLTAFFLEAAFLGVLLFGRSLVPRWLHFFAALMVAFGTLFSSFWILATNSWMQTPAGYKLIDGRFFPTDWMAIIFNPSFVYRLAHTVTAFYVTTAFVVLGVAAWLIRSDRAAAEGRAMLSTTLWLLLALVPLQIGLGDAQGLNTLKYQPTKIAAIEARWETMAGAPLTLFAIPDQARQRNDFSIDVPVLGGLILLAVVLIGNALRRRGRVYESAAFLRVCQWVAPLGFLAVLAGWTTTEVGRQPWTVYGLMRTTDSVTPSLTGADVALSLAGYMVVYLIMFPAGLALMARIVRRSFAAETSEGPVESGRPRSPIEALTPAPDEARER